jgi:peptide/nickel transport system substrate-binding protein
MLAINDPTARVAALLSGSVHLINRVDPKVAEPLTGNSQIRVFELAGLAHYTFPMRCDTPPFLALKYGIDRQEILDRVLLGHGKLGKDTPIARLDPSMPPISRSGPMIQTRPASA